MTTEYLNTFYCGSCGRYKPLSSVARSSATGRKTCVACNERMLRNVRYPARVKKNTKAATNLLRQSADKYLLALGIAQPKRGDE